MAQNAIQRVFNAMKNGTLNQTMIRTKDPKKSVDFYEKHFNMRLIDIKTFSDFTLYYLISLTEEKEIPAPGTPQASEYLCSGEYGCCLELTHNHGTEIDPSFFYHNGNSTPLGFSHIGFLVENMCEKRKELNEHGLTIKQLYNDSFVYVEDPDGYWVSLTQRLSPSPLKKATFHHTTLRVKNIASSLDFYASKCGFQVIHRIDHPEENFSRYILGKNLKTQSCISDEQSGEKFVFSCPETFLELIHIHGTENDTSLAYHSGNSDPRGFGHLAFMVDDVYEVSSAMEESGIKMQKRPNEGRMKGLAFALDPDGYWIELVKKNGTIPEST